MDAPILQTEGEGVVVIAAENLQSDARPDTQPVKVFQEFAIPLVHAVYLERNTRGSFPKLLKA